MKAILSRSKIELDLLILLSQRGDFDQQLPKLHPQNHLGVSLAGRQRVQRLDRISQREGL